MTTSILPKLSIKGLTVVESSHEKYGVTKTLKLSGKSGKVPRIAVEVDGVLHSMSLGSENTGKQDGEGNDIWVPVMRLQEIKASVPKAVEAKSLNTAKVSKTNDAKLQAEYEEFLAFKAMRAAAAK